MSSHVPARLSAYTQLSVASSALSRARLLQPRLARHLVRRLHGRLQRAQRMRRLAEAASPLKSLTSTQRVPANAASEVALRPELHWPRAAVERQRCANRTASHETAST